MTIKLIVGLQNPGAAYAQTRHNAGGWFAQRLAHHYNASFKLEKKLYCELADLELNDVTCKLILPTTFMNHSGRPVQAITQFYKIKPEEILVAHDELDLDTGRIKLKTGGGHGGHNGLRDIIAQLGGNGFHRLRVGIGHPGHKDLVTDFVLSKPSTTDRQQILTAIDKAIDIIPMVIRGDMANAMNKIN